MQPIIILCVPKVAKLGGSGGEEHRVAELDSRGQAHDSLGVVTG